MLIGVIAGAAPLAAQTATSCAGPGAAFGITSYQCASCSMKGGGKGRPYTIFQAELVVLESVGGWSAFWLRDRMSSLVHRARTADGAEHYTTFSAQLSPGSTTSSF